MLNGRSADGVPPLESKAQSDRWVRVLHQEYQQLCRDCAHRHRSVFDCYGATNEAEFFAVATEAFFEKPNAFRQHHEPLYKLFGAYYGQDPATRAIGH